MEWIDGKVTYHWSRFCICLTIGLTAGAPCIMYHLILADRWLGVLMSAYIVGILGYFFLQCPRAVIHTEEGLDIVLLHKKIHIPKHEIVKVRKITREEFAGSYRLWSSSGYFGYTGQLKNPRLGTFHMYATELKHLVLIETVRKNYLISYHRAASL